MRLELGVDPNLQLIFIFLKQGLQSRVSQLEHAYATNIGEGGVYLDLHAFTPLNTLNIFKENSKFEVSSIRSMNPSCYCIRKQIATPLFDNTEVLVFELKWKMIYAFQSLCLLQQKFTLRPNLSTKRKTIIDSLPFNHEKKAVKCFLCNS